MLNDKFQASQIQALIRELELQTHKAESFWTKEYSTKAMKKRITEIWSPQAKNSKAQ